MISFIQFVRESSLMEGPTTLKAPYLDWGFLQPTKPREREQNAWVDMLGSQQNSRDIEQMKAAYEARKKYPHIKVVHPVDPSHPDAGWHNDEFLQGVSDEWIGKENKKYEDLVKRHAAQVPSRTNAASGRTFGAANHEELAKKLGYPNAKAALQKGLVQYVVGGQGTVTHFAAQDHQKSHQVIADYLHNNHAVKGTVLMNFLNQKGGFDTVEFPNKDHAIRTLKASPGEEPTTMQIKGQRYTVVGQQSDKKHAGWVHYVLKGKDGKLWGVSRNEAGSESDLIPLKERSLVPPESVDTTWGDGWS